MWHTACTADLDTSTKYNEQLLKNQQGTLKGVVRTAFVFSQQGRKTSGILRKEGLPVQILQYCSIEKQ